MQNAPRGAFCNTFDLHYVIIGLENKLVVFLGVAVLHRFYCISFENKVDPDQLINIHNFAMYKPGSVCVSGLIELILLFGLKNSLRGVLTNHRRTTVSHNVKVTAQFHDNLSY